MKDKIGVSFLSGLHKFNANNIRFLVFTDKNEWAIETFDNQLFVLREQPTYEFVKFLEFGQERNTMKPETIEEEKIFIPRVIAGGKTEPPDLSGPDWLSALPVRTTVWIQSKKDTSFPLGQLTILHKGTKGIVIAIDGKAVPVDPIRFCSQYRHYETVQTAEEAVFEESVQNLAEGECMANGHLPSEPSELG